MNMWTVKAPNGKFVQIPTHKGIITFRHGEEVPFEELAKKYPRIFVPSGKKLLKEVPEVEEVLEKVEEEPVMEEVPPVEEVLEKVEEEPVLEEEDDLAAPDDVEPVEEEKPKRGRRSKKKKK